MHEELLDKTTRINLLFDFYEALLTDKQRVILQYYFHEDFSLGEIAAEFHISRQAVFEHVKRAEQVLEDCESKLGLLGRHETMRMLIDRMDEAIGALPQQTGTETLRELVRNMRDAAGGTAAEHD